MKTAALGDVAEFINGFAFRPEDWHEYGLPIIRIQNLTDPSKPANYTTKAVDDRYRVRRGDLLVSWSATLGVYIWDRSDEALVNQHIFRVIPDRRLVEPSFLRYMLNGALNSMERHLHGATMKHVNRAEFLATRIPLPHRDEQRRIGAILDHADSLRSMSRLAVTKLEELASAIFTYAFGEDVIGRLWPTVRLGDVVSTIDSGTSPICETRSATNGEWGVLKLGAISYGVFRPQENKAFLGDPALIRKVEVEPGDLLFSRKNTKELVGATAVAYDAPPQLLLPDLIFRLNLDREQVDAEYLQALLRTPRTRAAVVALASGSASSMSNISKGRLVQLPIELPPIGLQRAYSGRVRRVNDLRSKRLKANAELDELFASLQTRAFSGQL